MLPNPVACFTLCITLGFFSVTAGADVPFESAPIDYEHAPTSDPVSRLQKRMDAGEVKLTYDEERGYLPSVLEQLGVPKSSQMLVFSQTSFQLRKISSERPRAIYFNDHAYVGWVQFGDVVEVSSVDPSLGAVFYTLDQRPTGRPKFVRDKGQCLTCHASSRTQGVPGHLVRSVFADRGGVPLLGSGTFTTDHTSPFSERWGGWYVSGTHGDQRHMGNSHVTNRNEPEKLDRETGANVTDLSKLVNLSPYLSRHSDLVALMVLEHQTQTHNAITRANFECRLAEHQDKIMNEALGRPANHQTETTQRRIAAVGDDLVKYLLFKDEYQLTSPVRGQSEFAVAFAAVGPRDQLGRSLRDFDLKQRMFKYPCSYLIYSPSFDALPKRVKNHVYRGLHQVLSGEDNSDDFVHLSADDRQAIFEILSETKPDFARARSSE
jgi:hypothetical protein